MYIQGASSAESFLTGPQFAQFRLVHDLSVDELCRWLGCDRSEYLDMEKRGVPKIAALALSAIDYGLNAWTPAVLGAS